MNAPLATSQAQPTWNADPLRRMRFYLRQLVNGEQRTFYAQGVHIVRYDDMVFGVTRKGYALLFTRTKNCKSLDSIINRAAKFACGMATDDIDLAEDVGEFDA